MSNTEALKLALTLIEQDRRALLESNAYPPGKLTIPANDPAVDEALAQYDEAVHAIRSALAQQASVPSVEPAADLREKLIAAIAAGLVSTYHCNRVWSAWHVGTMSQDDFSPVDESDTPAELADAVLSIIGAAPQEPQR